MITQMRRQGDAESFQVYNYAKLGMMREALAKLNRERTSGPTEPFYSHFLHGQVKRSNKWLRTSFQ